jgi:hypothetical protein
MHKWYATWGGFTADACLSDGYFANGTGASGSGLSVAGGLIMERDWSRGTIDHAIAIGVPETRASVVAVKAG